MKKAAVPTTTARGTAVSRSRITAVQSVYIAAAKTGAIIPGDGHFGRRLACFFPWPSSRPTGNTGLDAIDARFGLMEEASPGWNEFVPYEGDDDMFGGNET